MSKKRIRYLLAGKNFYKILKLIIIFLLKFMLDKQMTSSSGTDETSDDEQYNEPDRHGKK